MNTWSRIWNEIKSEIDIWFFYGFLLTFPFSIRKVITHYPIQGQFNEWSGIYLYLSDIFLILTLFSWLIILCNKYDVLSIYNSLSLPKDNLWKRPYPQVTPKHFLAYLGLILALWSFLSFFWSESKSLSLFRSFKLFEFYLLALFIAYRIVPRGTILKDSLKLIILGGVINSVIAIWQFLIQHSIGLSFLKESAINPSMPGVAKIILNGQVFIRSYGFFPHPNILAGFLLFSTFLTLFYRRMFHVEHLENSTMRHFGLDPESILKNSDTINRSRIKSGMTCFFWIILAVQLLALILTFSKSAIIGLIIAILYINVPRLPVRRMFQACPSEECSTSLAESRRAPARPKNVPRGTFEGGWNITKILLLTFFAIFAIISIFPNLSPIQNQSLKDRAFLMDSSGTNLLKLFHNTNDVPRLPAEALAKEGGTIKENTILGIGQGQLVWSIRNLDIESWQFQPVHNVFLLIWSELGIVGLILFVWLLWRMFHVEHSKEGGILLIFQGILLGFIFIMLFDHYLWDIQQGQVMLWMLFGFVQGFCLTNQNKSDIISL